MSQAPQLSENAPHILHPLGRFEALYEAVVEIRVNVPIMRFRQLNCGARLSLRPDEGKRL